MKYLHKEKGGKNKNKKQQSKISDLDLYSIDLISDYEGHPQGEGREEQKQESAE